MKRIGLILFFLFSFTQNAFSAGKIIDTRLTDSQTCEAIYDEINFADSVIEKNNLLGDVEIHNLTINDGLFEFNADITYRVDIKLNRMTNLIKKFDYNKIIKERLDENNESSVYAVCEFSMPKAIFEKKVPNYQIKILNTKKENFKQRKILLYADGTFTFEYKSDITIEKNFNFKKFPFETTSLFITLSSEFNNYLKIAPTSYTTELEKSKMWSLKIPGWDIKFVNVYSGEEFLEDGIEGYENDLITQIYIKRTFVSYLIKFFVPILFIVMISYSGFWIEEKDLKTRVELSIVCLLSLIAFNFVISDKLPDLPYMTFLDTFVLISYFFAGLNTVISIIIFRVPYIPRTDRRNISLNDEFKVWMPSAYLLSNLAAWAFLWNKI